MKITFSILYFMAAGQGVILSFVPLLKTKNKVQGSLLSLLIMAISIQLISYGFAYSGWLVYTPHLWGISSIIFFLTGPLIYLIIKYNKPSSFHFELNDFLHFIPAIAILFYRHDFYFRSTNAKRIALEGIHEFVPSLSVSAYVIAIISIVQLLAYTYASYSLIRKNRSKTESAINKWLIKILFTYVTVYIIYKISVYGGWGYYSTVCYLCKSIMCVCIYGIAYSFFTTNPFKSNPGKYNKSSLSPSYSAALINRLQELMQKEELYKNNLLTLDVLAEKMNCSTHDMSQLINSNYNQGFSSFINSYRIAHAKNSISKDPSIKLWQVSMDSGFNNRVTFTTSFKKIEGCTPSEFKQRVEKTA